MRDKNKPTPPLKPSEPPIRRVVNEKVINKKEIEEWSSRSTKR